MGTNNAADYTFQFGQISTVNGRITPTSGNPIINSGTAITTLYFTPYLGNQIGLYDGSSIWNILAFSETSFAVPATTNQMYDVFGYNNSGTFAIATVAWTNDTTRATALAYQNGILCKSGALQYRYLGSFRTGTVSGQTILSGKNILVWNYYNQLQFTGTINASVGSWVVSTNGGARQLNGGSSGTYTFNVICGLATGYVHNMFGGFFIPYNSAGAWTGSYYMGWGYNATNAIQATGNSIDISSNNGSQMSANFMNTAAAGFQYYAYLEYCGVSANQFTVYDNNSGIGHYSAQQFTCMT